MGKSPSYLPIYRVEPNLETNRMATYVYFSPDQKEGTGRKVPAMPKYRTTGDPKKWEKGQIWERATTYKDEEKTQPNWEQIYHAGRTEKHPDWEEKSKYATTMPQWSAFPAFRYNYFAEYWEIKDSPFDEWTRDLRDRQVKNVDHQGFVRLWYSKNYKSIAGIAKHLGWSRAKVINRKGLVQAWLDKWEQHELTLKYKPEFTENEREDWLAQHEAPTSKEIASIAHLFGIDVETAQLNIFSK